jgi:hypothetical protein
MAGRRDDEGALRRTVRVDCEYNINKGIYSLYKRRGGQRWGQKKGGFSASGG